MVYFLNEELDLDLDFLLLSIHLYTYPNIHLYTYPNIHLLHNIADFIILLYSVGMSVCLSCPQMHYVKLRGQTCACSKSDLGG